ncbi:hypothetical protein [Acidovorax sp. SDU_ACID1]|uniref:hypothetical protein n=1 Tax=Acidovorax sp. SDU_ACID1 TaxID=3136632 RepID=UPI00387383C5
MALAHSSQLMQNALRAELPHVAHLLRHRRASEIDEATIENMVLLSWLEWWGGSLQLTTTGKNICDQQQLANASVHPQKGTHH